MHAACPDKMHVVRRKLCNNSALKGRAGHGGAWSRCDAHKLPARELASAVSVVSRRFGQELDSPDTQAPAAVTPDVEIISATA
eukprot:1160492-Pelagomonas_calceolata.AAC.9